MRNFSFLLLELHYLLLKILDPALFFQLLGMESVQCFLFDSGLIFLFQNKQVLQLMTNGCLIYLDLLSLLSDFELRKSRFGIFLGGSCDLSGA